MPGRGTPKITLRIDPQLWERLGQAAQAAGADRAAVIRALVLWYVREPGAELPDRPPPTRQT